MKKLLSFIMALAMLLSCAAAEGFTPAESYDTGDRIFFGGNVTLEAAPAGGGSVTSDVYAGIAGKDYTDEKVYTYNGYTGGTSNLNWNPHSWETSDDSAILDYLVTGLYTFSLNANRDGYSVVPEAAAAMPVDVTAEYVGKFGVAEGESAKAWRIALNPDMRWNDAETFEDCTLITADDYIYGMQQQLNPKMLNRRADSWYAGDFAVVNAKNYLYAGKTTYDLITDTAENLTAAGQNVYMSVQFCVDLGLWAAADVKDAEGNTVPSYVSIADEVKYGEGDAAISIKEVFDTYLATGTDYASYQTSYLYTASIAPDTQWEDVGFVKVDDYTIDIILESPVAEAAFYMPYNLSSSVLVYKPLYESCKSFWDESGNSVATEAEAATVTTNYCTSIETSMSCGPYDITYYELDKQYTLSRNENWFGYHDGKHLGQYQTDAMVYEVIKEHATAMMAFEKGEIDEVALDSADMEKYASSAYLMYTPQSYTSKLSFNTNYEKLLERGTNCQIMVIDEFRQAFAFAMDRSHFTSAYTAAASAGYGLMNYMYCYDPFTGALYRDSDAAKAALCRVYEVAYGEGEDYATLDEAYEAITGYNMPKAKELMQTAYDKAVAAGIYDGVSPITIDIRLYSADTTYVQMFTYFDVQLKEACAGTSLEGKVSMTMTVDPDYYESNYSGNADMIYTTWGGAAMNPFGILANCYTDAADGSGNQMEYGFETDKIDVTFNVDGKEVTFDLQTWSEWCRSDKNEVCDVLGNFADYSYTTRCEFVAGLEACFLSYYTTTPMYYRNSAALRSQKINYGTDTYLQVIGRGGIAFVTYNYDDAAWADYIANNTLVY